MYSGDSRSILLILPLISSSGRNIVSTIRDTMNSATARNSTNRATIVMVCVTASFSKS